jgi:hypothetical protein
MCQAGENGVVRLCIDATDIGRDTTGAVGESSIPQITDKGADIGLVQASHVHLAGDRQGDQQNRIAERIFVGPGAQAGGEVQKFLGQDRGR